MIILMGDLVMYSNNYILEFIVLYGDDNIEKW